MTKLISAPRGRKVGRPPHDDYQIYIAATAVCREAGLSLNALPKTYTLTFVSQDRCAREWTVIEREAIRQRHSKVNAAIFKFPKQMAKRGAPELLQRAKAVVDRQVDDYVAAQGPEWRISLQSYGDEIRRLRSRQYRRGAVRHVRPKKPTPDK